MNPDETAQKEQSHLDLHCLQMCVRIYLMSKFTRLYPKAHNNNGIGNSGLALIGLNRSSYRLDQAPANS